MRKRVFKFKELTFIFFISAAFVIGGTLWSYFTLSGISQPLILHYGLGQITQVGSIWGLLGVGFISLMGVFINFTLALIIEERDKFLGKFLGAATLLMSLLLFIGFAAIISVN